MRVGEGRGGREEKRREQRTGRGRRREESRELGEGGGEKRAENWEREEGRDKGSGCKQKCVRKNACA